MSAQRSFNFSSICPPLSNSFMKSVGLKSSILFDIMLSDGFKVSVASEATILFVAVFLRLYSKFPFSVSRLIKSLSFPYVLVIILTSLGLVRLLVRQSKAFLYRLLFLLHPKLPQKNLALLKI